MKFEIEKYKLLILLIFTDIVFVVMHILYLNTDLLPSSLYSLSRDRGYAEFFQYTKELWIAILLFLLGIKQRRALYCVFSFLFLYFLVDDSVEFHEGFGGQLVDFFNLQPALGLRAVDWGELLVSVVFGLLFVISIALFYVLSDLTGRRIAIYLIGMIAILAVFGVALDMLGILITHSGAKSALILIEEAGEMLVMSVITWFMFRIQTNQGKEPAGLTSS
jgi:hypothetical protein